MAFLPVKYDLSFASNTTVASVTSALDLNGTFLYVYVVVPTMSVGYSTASTPLWIQASYDGTTFFRFTNTEPTNNTLVAGINDFVIASSVSQRVVNIPNFACRYLRLEMSGTVTNPTAQTGGFKVIAVSNQ